MPVNDLGYRSWNGKLTPPSTRWMAIALSGIKIVFKSQWIKRLMFVAWGPALVVGICFFAYEQYVENRDNVITSADVGDDEDLERPGRRDRIRGPRGFEEDQARERRRRRQQNGRVNGYGPVVWALGLLSGYSEAAEKVIESFEKEPNEARGTVWSFILFNMLRNTQGWMVLLMIGIIVPPLIANDIRSRAFLFYFSKPISRFDYLLGKFITVGTFVGFITIVPVVALYLFGVMLSPSFDVIYSTWDLPFRAIAACLVMVVPSCLIALMFSSLTSESRFAGFAWFMVWILGYIGYQIIRNLNRFNPEFNNSDGTQDSLWCCISLHDSFGYLQYWIMGLGENHTLALKVLAYIVGISTLSVYVIMRKISAPIKA